MGLIDEIQTLSSAWVVAFGVMLVVAVVIQGAVWGLLIRSKTRSSAWMVAFGLVSVVAVVIIHGQELVSNVL